MMLCGKGNLNQQSVKQGGGEDFVYIELKVIVLTLLQDNLTSSTLCYEGLPLQ